MELEYLYVIGFIVLAVLGYFLAVALFNLLKTLIENFKGGLKSIFVLLAIVVSVWIIRNPDEAQERIETLKFWEDEANDEPVGVGVYKIGIHNTN